MSGVDAEKLASMQNWNWLLVPLMQKFGREPVEDFWQARIANRRMGGSGRGRRRSPEQKFAIEQDRLARMTARAEKSERQKRNHRLIVLGARLEESAKSAGVDPLRLQNLTEEDWDKFFYDEIEETSPDGGKRKIKKPASPLIWQIKKMEKLLGKKEERSE